MKDIASASAHELLNASQTENLSKSLNPEFGMYSEDLSFDSETTSSESDHDGRYFVKRTDLIIIVDNFR